MEKKKVQSLTDLRSARHLNNTQLRVRETLLLNGPDKR